MMVLGIGTGWSAPVDPGKIPAQAVWFAHFDLEKIHSMPLFQACPIMNDPESKPAKRIARLNERIGLDVRRDILSVTAFCSQYEGQFGVAVISLRPFDRKQLTAAFQRKWPEHRSETYHGLTLVTWQVKAKRVCLPEMTGAFFDDKTIVVGIDRDHVKHALDVLAGRQPGMSPDAILLRGMMPDSIWMANAIEVPAPYQLHTKCPVLKHCVSASARWWESEGWVMGRYNLKAVNPETARLFVQAMDGMKAVAALKFAEFSPVLKHLEALSYKADGPYFTLSWRGAMAEIVKTVKAMKGHVKIRIK
jgi:hypothetical protein